MRCHERKTDECVFFGRQGLLRDLQKPIFQKHLCDLKCLKIVANKQGNNGGFALRRIQSGLLKGFARIMRQIP
jgi:hypothetical protein